MTYKTYEIVCSLSAEAALERIKGLLSDEGVEYRVGDLSITSVRTPLAVFSFQRVLYSRHNWVGLNPFTFISGIEVQCEPSGHELTKVAVRVNRFRALMWVAFLVWSSLGVAVAFLPDPIGVIFAVGGACAAWFGIVSFLGGYLIRKEIGGCLKFAA